MANVLVQESSLQDIADAIRSKNGTQNTYKPAQMAEAIEAISGGGITPTGTKQISITQNGTTTEDVTNYASAEITVNVSVGSSDFVIPLDILAWEVGAVNGSTSKTYSQNKTSNTARLRGTTLFQTYNLPLKLSANWSNGEWTIQYSKYNESGVCTSGFTPLTSDGIIDESPYIAIVIRHTDGTTEMNVSDVNTIKPVLSYES